MYENVFRIFSTEEGILANIQDVAKRAGVSIATVSRVLNGRNHVNEDVIVRVRTAAQELQYQPSRAARALRANQATIIGLLITDIQNPFFTELVRGVEDVAQRNGYSLILCNSDEDPQKEQQYIEVLCAERVAGAIVVPTREQQRTLKLFHKHTIPVVTVDRRVKDDETDTVLVDNIRGAREATAHLLTNGYRRIGMISRCRNCLDQARRPRNTADRFGRNDHQHLSWRGQRCRPRPDLCRLH